MSKFRLRCPGCGSTDLDVHVIEGSRCVFIECVHCGRAAWNSRIVVAAALRADCRRRLPPDQAELDARRAQAQQEAAIRLHAAWRSSWPTVADVFESAKQ